MSVSRVIYGSMTESELLSRRTDLRKQLADLVSGKAFASVSGSGKSFTRQQPMIREVESHLVAIEQALNAKDPAKYPLTVTKRLHADFSR